MIGDLDATNHQSPHKFFAMKKLDWMKVAGMNLLIIAMILAPFLPGPPNELVLGMSLIGGFMGILGLALVPVGIIWTILEIKKIRSIESPNWKPSYTMAIIATVMFAAFCVLIEIGISLTYGSFACALGIVLGILGFKYVFKELKNLKNNTDKKICLAPLYLSTVPLTALVVQLFLMKPASHFSRNVAIEKSQELIASVEAYKSRHGQYPENMDELKLFMRFDMPSPKVMGIQEYNYKRSGDDYNIGFKQNLDFGLEEIVVYAKNNRHEDYYFTLKGALESYDSEYAHWRYFWCD